MAATLGLGVVQVLQDRQRERRRLPRARLSARQHISSLQERRDGLSLDGSRGMVILSGYRALERLDEIELLESSHTLTGCCEHP